MAEQLLATLATSMSQMAEAVKAMAQQNAQTRGSIGKVMDRRRRQWPQF